MALTVDSTKRSGASKPRVYSLNPRPDFSLIHKDMPNYTSTVIAAYNWMSEEMTVSELKQEVVDWALGNEFDTVALLELADHRFTTLGKIAVMLREGAYVKPEAEAKLRAFVADVERQGIQKKLATQVVPPKTPKLPVSPGLNVFDSVEDAIIQNNMTLEELSEVVIDAELNIPELNVLGNRVAEALQDWTDATGQAQEMQTIAGDERVAQVRAAYNAVLNVIKMLGQNVKAERKAARKRKGFDEKKAAKLVKNVRTKKVDTKYNVVSLPADEIVGATSVLVFNTKNRRLNYFVAEAGATLSVRGTSVLNFNDDKSLSKILRNPERDLAAFRSANNARRIEVLINDTIKGVTHKANGRLNADTVILKAFK